VDLPLPVSDAVLVVKASMRRRKEEVRHDHERFPAATRPAATDPGLRSDPVHLRRGKTRHRGSFADTVQHYRGSTGVTSYSFRNGC
jgi:hypothetical protein